MDGRRIITLSLAAAFLLGISWSPLIVTSRGEDSQAPSGPRWDLLDEPWDNLTDWVIGGTGTSEISPAGQLHNVAGAGRQVYRTKNLGRLPESGYMVETLVSIDNFGTGDGWFGYGFHDGLHEVSIRIYANRVGCGGQNLSVASDNNWHTWTFVIYSTANVVQVYRDNTHLVTWTGSLPLSTKDGKVDASITGNPAGQSGAESHTDHLRMATIPTPAIGYTVAFTALDWDETTGISNLTVAMFSNDTLCASTTPTNGTGYAEAVGVEAGNYTVRAFFGPLCLGLNESVMVTGNQTVTLRCWTYDVNVECLNAYGEAASGIWVVMTLVDGGAGYLSSSGAGGVARFEDLPNGTYVVRPLSGRTVTGVNLAAQSVNVTEDERNATLRCDVADLAVRVVTREGGPLVNATTRLIDSSTPPRLVGTQQTNATGHIQYKNLPVESYAFTVEWMHALFSITHDKLNLSLPENRTFSMECDVYNLTIACLDMWGRKAPGADVTISVLVGGAVRERHYTADPSGMVFEQLPGDSYEVRVTYGIYSGSAAVSLTESKAVEVRCGISLMASTYTAATVVAWVVLGAGWEWRRRGAFHQVMRLRGMMSKLESLYQKGEIEYSHYQKLKAEYEERLEGLRRRGLE